MFLSTVFVGTVRNVTQAANYNAITTFEVTDVLHSEKPLGSTVDVHHSVSGPACGRTFAVGKTYVVYAYGDAQLSVSACSRTHEFQASDEDVAYAHARPTRTQAMVDGVVRFTDGSGPLAGITVRARGTSASATADKQGKFKLMLPPGDYELEVSTPGLRGWPAKVSLPVAAACANPRVDIAVDGRIEGQLSDAKGRPVVGLEVFAEPKFLQASPERLSGKTDALGKYVIRGVPMGTFKVGVSLPDFGGVSPASPYPRTWYPGEAKVDRRGLKTGIDFVLPLALPVSKVRGTVVRKDGSIPRGVVVTVVPEGKLRSTSAPVDAKGEFSFEEMTGFEVVIRACEQQRCVDDLRILNGDVSVQLTLPE